MHPFLDRRRWLLWAGALAGAPGGVGAQTAGAAAAPRLAAEATPVSLRAPEPLAQLRAHSAGGANRADGLLAVTRTGKVLRASAAALQSAASNPWQTLGTGLDPHAPLAFGHGRVVGRSANGPLWVWETDRNPSTTGPDLAANAGLLVLPFAVIAVTQGSDGVYRLVRLEPSGNTWAASAHSRSGVLPDARPLQFDPDSSTAGNTADTNGHVLAFAAPSSTRYPQRRAGRRH
jgi:hypothetical protein